MGSKNLKKGPWDSDGRREIYNKSYLDKAKYEYLLNIVKLMIWSVLLWPLTMRVLRFC